MFVFKAAVVGAGTMGGEIAHTIANADLPVVLKDVEPKFVDHGLEKARSLWQARVDAGKLEASELRAQARADHRRPPSYDGFGDVDFVIEAVPERMEIKQAVFAELDEVTPGHAILASNTSSLSITEIGEATGRPDKVVGFHFFYPASVMRLIEVIEGEDTSPETRAGGEQLRPDDQQDADPLRRGAGLRRQPDPQLERVGDLALSGGDRASTSRRSTRSSRSRRPRRWARSSSTDLLGLDTVLHVAEHLQDSYGERFFVHRQMQELVAAGDLGAKTGKGFYEHGKLTHRRAAQVDWSPTASRSRRSSRAAWCSRRASRRSRTSTSG